MAILIKIKSINESKALDINEEVKGELMCAPVVGGRLRIHVGPGTMFQSSDITDVIACSGELFIRTMNSYYRLLC